MWLVMPVRILGWRPWRKPGRWPGLTASAPLHIARPLRDTARLDATTAPKACHPRISTVKLPPLVPSLKVNSGQNVLAASCHPPRAAAVETRTGPLVGSLGNPYLPQREPRGKLIRIFIQRPRTLPWLHACVPMYLPVSPAPLLSMRPNWLSCSRQVQRPDQIATLLERFYRARLESVSICRNIQ